MMKKVILTAAIAAVVAVSAQAQTFAQIGEILPISNSVEASGSNVTYEWYYSTGPANNVTTAIIPGCSGVDATSCVVPANVTGGFTDGQVVNFYRRATAMDCATGNTKNTTPITVTFANVVVSGVRWANYHSTTPNAGLTTGAGNEPRFAATHNLVDYRYFQFNRACAWSTTGDAGTPCGAAWNTTPDNGGNWNETTAPVCPTGWRLPTNVELAELVSNSNPIRGRWVTAAQSGFPVNGRMFGPRAFQCTSTSMAGCVFFPASGERLQATAALASQGSYGPAWTGVQGSVTNAFFLHSTATGGVRDIGTANKAYGYPVRCVQ